MTYLRCKTASRVLPVLVVLILAVSSWAQQRPPIVEKLAKAYGFDSYAQIDAMRYTFNLQLPGLKLNLSRTWTWEPKTQQVTYEGPGKDGKPVKVTYLRSQISSQSADVKDNIDPNFVNDNYWFLLPFHIYWDKSATVTDEGMQKLPIGKGTAEKVVVKYPSNVGYTPGDTWDLYVGSDARIQAMVYHRGGPKKPSLVTASWAGYKMAGPLLVSTDHRGSADGAPLTLSFTNVAVKLAGSNTWTDAK
jgi:hypothetical protein